LNPSVHVPVEWVESIIRLRLPAKADHRRALLMDRNNEGPLSNAERSELESLVELSEPYSLVRAGAFQVLGRIPE